MGARRQRIEKLRLDHPVCYFCATSPTETEDHVPSRECFRGRLAPEDFTFPACKKCNQSASQIEQVVALYLILADHSGKEPPTNQLSKLLLGVNNNNKELLPHIGLSANMARRYYRKKGLSLSPGATFSEAPLLQLPKGNRVALERFARRLTCAIYYKEMGHPLPLDNYVAVSWLLWSDPTSKQVLSAGRELFKELTIGNRRNTDIGEQFFYNWRYNPDESIFGFSAQFSKSFIFFGATIRTHAWNGEPNWKPHSSDIVLTD